MTNPFYMLHVEGNNSPTVRHSTLDAAMTEATRLAHTQGRPVTILKSVATATRLPAPIEWTNYSDCEA